MKIESRNNEIFLTEVFSGVGFETDSREVLGVCMRDSGYELTYGDKHISLQEGRITIGSTTFIEEDGFDEITDDIKSPYPDTTELRDSEENLDWLDLIPDNSTLWVVDIEKSLCHSVGRKAIEKVDDDSFMFDTVIYESRLLRDNQEDAYSTLAMELRGIKEKSSRQMPDKKNLDWIDTYGPNDNLYVSDRYFGNLMLITKSELRKHDDFSFVCRGRAFIADDLHPNKEDAIKSLKEK